jgi:hypothetical protein
VTTGAATGRDGYLHEVAVYDSDDELVRLVRPFLEAGVAAGEPTFAALQEHEAAVVRPRLGDPSGVTFWPALAADEQPPAVIKRLTSLLGDLAAGGVEQIRVVNTVPHPGLGAPWDGWCRYEAAVNELLGAFPVWGMCLYDRRITPRHVLSDIQRTHPRIAENGSHLPNDRYQDPRSFILSLAPPPDPLEAEPPTVEITNPTPAMARYAVQDTAQHTRLSNEEVGRLVLAASEAVTNAVTHGRPPVTMRAWPAPERMVITVSDTGAGPQDPYVGLVPSPSAFGGGGGFGLWIAHQLLPVALSRGEGFTIRLVAGRALP